MITNCNANIHKISKLVIICTILTLLSYVFFSYIYISNVLATVTQTRESYSTSKIEKYPGYKERIESLKKAHPNWTFTIFYTGLDWNQVIQNETTAHHGRNVVPASNSSAWKCSLCGETPYGGSSWRCASAATVSYYMDPRNWLNDSYIFEFENLSYNSSTQTAQGVQKIISDIKYMQGNTVTYTKTDGSKATINKSYAQIIMDSAKEAGISPYHLASRIRQEQGTDSTPGSTATGTYSGYVGYYNFLNIKAGGRTNSQVIVNGLTYAKEKGWTDPEKSIKAGAKMLASSYINDGQDTLYLQKFDVDNSDGTLFVYQYMQNVSATLTEGASAKSAYQNLGLIDSSIEFIIPVYENMPISICSVPQESTIVTQSIRVNGTDVRVREIPSTSGAILTNVNTGDILLRIETAANKDSQNIYWDKVVLPDGRKGYMSRSYIVQIDDVTNCNDSMITTTGVYLRNGPGTNNTTIITLLSEGQILTRIEKEKYNVDGYTWDRVKLSNGTQGYIASNYIKLVNSTKTSNDNFKIENSNLVCEPETTIDTIKNKYSGQKVTVTKADGTIVSSGNLGTGYKVIVNDSTYTVVKLGDSNGDGKINSADLLRIQKHLLNFNKITDQAVISAADTTKDGKINSADLLKIQKHLLNVSKISL